MLHLPRAVVATRIGGQRLHEAICEGQLADGLHQAQCDM
jgi:hypothetical protein